MNELKIDDLILLTIKRIGINGEGIGYYKRLAVFVTGAIEDEIVEVKITKVEEKFAYGEIVKFKKKSPYRIEPKCQYFGKCGGCQLQHVEYKHQLEIKKNLVQEAFSKYYEGDISKVAIKDTIGMSDPWQYRNKTQLPARHDGDKVVVGIYALDTNKLVFIDECLIENALITNTMKQILEYLTKKEIDVYNPRFRQGTLRHIVLRGLEETNEVQATFVFMKEDRRLVTILKELINIKNIVSVNYTINSDPKAIEIINNKVVNIAGTEKIKGKLGELIFSISPESFLQLNSKQTIVLYDLIKDIVKPNENDRLLDCYCGIGSIGLYLAKNVKEVRGIDIDKENIKNAKEFASMNNITNSKFYCGNILKYLKEFEEEFVPNIMIIDPPRKGMELSLINYLQKSKIRKIIYVSCNPSTLAKNVNHLQKNYVIRSIQPIDMFPNTSNVECVVCLERR